MHTGLDFIDGDGNHRSEQTDVVGGLYVRSVTAVDPTSGNGAQVASPADNETISTSTYGLLVRSVGKLKNLLGTGFDTLVNAGIDLISPRGVQAVSAMLGKEILATSTTSIAPAVSSISLNVANTTGFVSGAPINLEPGTANYESALIGIVVANTSVSITFPTGGALFTHTQPFTVQTFQGNMPRQAPGGTGVALVSSDGTKPTYRAGAVAQTLYSGAAAVLVEIKGSATKTVRIKKITIWAQAATKFYSELTLLRCTGLSAGTPVVANIGKHDTTDAAATAVVNSFTAAATAGAGSAVIGALPLSTVIPSATALMQKTEWNFTQNTDKAMILRGTGDVLEVLNNTLTLGTATFGFEAEFEEDNS